MIDRQLIRSNVFLIAIAVGLSLVACREPPATENVVHFMTWRQHQAEALDEALDEFERRTQIRVERRIGSENASQYYRELTTKLRNRDPELDAFFLDVVWPAELAARGWLADLSDRVPAAERQEFFAAPIEACTVDGRLVALPFNIDVGLLFYRKDLLDAHGFGPPRTWAELLRQMDAILAVEGRDRPALVGWMGQLDRYEGLVCNLLEVVTSRGGRLFDPAGGPALAMPESLAAIDFVRHDLLASRQHPRRATEYLLTAREQESREVFARGDAIFLRGWPETWGILTDPARSKVADRVAMAPLPKYALGKAVGALGGWQLGIAAFSSRQPTAWELMRFLTSHEIQTRLAIRKSQTMSRLSIYSEPELIRARPHFAQAGPWGAPLKEACENAVPRPASARYNAISERIQRCLHEVLRDPTIDAAATLSACDAQVQVEATRSETP